jgi:hypothetical protein
MILETGQVLPVQELNWLDPARVEHYLRLTGWVRNAKLGRGKSMVYERPESRLKQVRIPTLLGLADFAILMGQAVAIIAEWEKRSPLDILNELLLPKPADLLRFREAGPATRNGDISLDHARDLLTGVRRLLLATAHSVLRPERFHTRLSLSDAEQFLQKCRMGQTERGSFTMTIACPLDAGSGPELFDQDPFTRRVTGLLMRSVERLSQCDSGAKREGILREVDHEPTLSANFCEGLLDLIPTDDDALLDIGAVWDRTLPASANHSFPSIIRISREIIPHVEYLAAKLRPAKLLDRQYYVGSVETLDGRTNAQNQREGDVVVRVVDADGEPRRARVELAAELYAVADQAHMQNRLISVEGNLRRHGQRFRIADPTGFQIIQPRNQPQTTS